MFEQLTALVVDSDGSIYLTGSTNSTDFDFSTLPQNPPGLAHLVLVDNPPQHALGDFVLRDGQVHDEPRPRLTFAGIGVYRPQLLAGRAPGKFSMVPILRAAMHAGEVSGEYYPGAWSDIGTPQRLTKLNAGFREI